MKVTDPDKTYIDYFQGPWCLQEGLANRFGVRVREGLFLAVVKIGDGRVNACGKEFRIPLQLKELPTHLRIIIYDHVLNYPASDLMDVVTGKISFQQALSLRAEKVIRSERRGRHATRPPIKTWLTRPAGINIHPRR